MLRALKNHWYKLSIKNKLLIFFVIIILCVSLLSIYTHNNAYRFMDQFNNNLNDYFRINTLIVQISENRSIIDKYLRELREEDLQQYRSSVQTINQTLSQVNQHSNSLKTYFLVNAIYNALDAYYKECESAIRVRKNLESDENHYIYYYKAVRISNYIEDYINQLLYVSLSEGSWSYNQLAQKSRIMRIVTFVSIFTILILCIGFGLIFSNYLTGPIRKLASISTQMAEGDLDVRRIEVRSKDEVGVLSEAFNKMSASIQCLVNDLKEKSIIENKLHEEEMKNIKVEELLKEAKFLGLQSQINPHFLFNTLNTIARTSMFENAPKTTKLIQALSNFFRYNLRSNTKVVTLAKEIENVKEYMYLQKYRFNERLKFKLLCNANMEAVQIPSLTLQPMVENAIIHGIEPKEEGGSVRIKIYEKSDMMVVKITDNGVGIPKDRVELLINNEDIQHTGHTTGIGISNVANRLKLYFRDEGSFKIKSKEGLGTSITITFPIREEA